jgi:hypothetical protein
MNANDREFPAGYDTTTKIISAVVVVVLAGIAAITRSWIAGSFAAVALLAGYAWSPRGYTVSGGSIRVRRLIGDACIPLADIREARPSKASDLTGAVRLFGSGGFFGYYGLFHTSGLGKSTWYVTNQDRAVIVIAGGKTALFSPDDPDGFLDAVRTEAPLPVSMGAAPAFESAAPSLAPKAIGLVLALCVVGMIAAVYFYSPGPPRVTVTSDSLTIHDRFYGVTVQSGAVDVDGIRVTDLATERAWRPTLRVNGFANRNYRAGWFRVASGRRVRMYRANGTRLVLLPPKGEGTAVLFETDDPEGFAADLRRRWGGR